MAIGVYAHISCGIKGSARLDPNIWINRIRIRRAQTGSLFVFSEQYIVSASGVAAKVPGAVSRLQVRVLNVQDSDHFAVQLAFDDTFDVQVQKPRPGHNDAVTATIADLAGDLIYRPSPDFDVVTL